MTQSLHVRVGTSSMRKSHVKEELSSVQQPQWKVTSHFRKRELQAGSVQELPSQNKFPWSLSSLVGPDKCRRTIQMRERISVPSQLYDPTIVLKVKTFVSVPLYFSHKFSHIVENLSKMRSNFPLKFQPWSIGTSYCTCH